MPLAVCATPIGNLDDVTLRVLEELREADVVLCEDTRHTRGLLERHGIRARLVSYHEHNEAKRTAELLPRLAAGERVALVSDAGLPGISDPGARLVAAAVGVGIPVTVLPGPSAVETVRPMPPARFSPLAGLPFLVAKVVTVPFLLSKALEDHGKDEAARERSADDQLGAV